jgi:hypothetical protein
LTGDSGAVEVVKFVGVGGGLVNEYDGELVAVDNKMLVDVELLAGLGYVTTGTGIVVVDTAVPGPVTTGTLDIVVGLKP